MDETVLEADCGVSVLQFWVHFWFQPSGKQIVEDIRGKRRRGFNDRGGLARRSPVTLVPHPGRRHVVVDLDGYAGRQRQHVLSRPC